MSTKVRIFKNAVSSLGLKGVRVLEQLFLIPFFIFFWGVEYYGEWLTIMIIPSVLAFSDMGLGTAVASSYVLKYSERNYSYASNILRTGFTLISSVIILVFLIFSTILYLLIQSEIFTSAFFSREEIFFSLILMILATFIDFYMQLYEANFRAVKKAHYAINLQTICSLLKVGGGFLALYNGFGAIGFAIIQLFISIFNNIFYGKVSTIVNNPFKIYKGEYCNKISKDILFKGLGYILTPVWQIILFQGTTLVVRIMLGPAAVVIFNTLRTLSRSVNQIYSIVGNSLFPEVQSSIGEKNFSKAEKILKKGIIFTFLIGLLGVIFLAFFGLPIYNLWTNKQIEPPYMLWFLLILSTFFNAIWWTASIIFRAMNKPFVLAISGSIISIVSIISTVFLCYLFGLVGVGGGVLFFEIMMSLYILPSSLKLLRES